MHFSNVHVVLCQIFGLGPPHPFLTPPSIASALSELKLRQEGSSGAEESKIKVHVRKVHVCHSEAWGPPQSQEKRSRSEKAILGALGELRGILGAALGIGNSILGIQNSILGMASRDLINTKPTILGATLGAIPGISANPPEKVSFAPAFSERFFFRIGVVPAHQSHPLIFTEDITSDCIDCREVGAQRRVILKLAI